MASLLAFDQGTTSSRALVFNEDGTVLSVAQKEFTQHYPKPGWVEHDPFEIWSSQISVASEALASVHASHLKIHAIGITNQRETTVLWDRKTGEPVYRAIVWQDRRTAPLCDRLRADGTEDLFRQKTGLLLDPYFSGTKIQWILDNVDGVRARAEKGELCFGTVDTWLIWKLTGGRVHATDPSNASRTLLYNIHTGSWDDELLKVLRVPREILPEIRPSSGFFGETTSSLGMGEVPVAGVAGDQQAALFGQACFTPGLAKNTYGTGCFLLQQTGPEAVASKNRLLTTVAWETPGGRDYALEGSVFIGGAVVQWLRDGLKVIRESSEVEALARSVPDAGGMFLVPAFTGLGAPHWDPYARGAMVGLTRGTTAAHIARAAIESIAFQVADLMEAMKLDSGKPPQQMRVDGGASANELLLQFQADLLQVPVARCSQKETTALGAACLAGLATGVYRDRMEVASRWSSDVQFEPKISADEAQQLRRRWSRAVERAKAWEEE